MERPFHIKVTKNEDGSELAEVIYDEEINKEKPQPSKKDVDKK